MLQLKWQSALITGGSRGIGRGIALKLAESGVKRIAINYRANEQAAKETARALEDRGAEALLVQADVTKTDDLTRMFATVKAEFGSLDIFVHNALQGLEEFFQPPLQASEKSLRNLFESQIKAMMLSCQQCDPLMVHGGRILAITYTPGAVSGSWQSWFPAGVAKAGLEATVRYFAVGLARKGITVNALSPGFTTDTRLDLLDPAVVQAASEWHTSGWTPAGRLGSPSDVGNAAALLCSEEAGFITGQTIYCDGGQNLMSSQLPLQIQKGE